MQTNKEAKSTVAAFQFHCYHTRNNDDIMLCDILFLLLFNVVVVVSMALLENFQPKS